MRCRKHGFSFNIFISLLVFLLTGTQAHADFSACPAREPLNLPEDSEQVLDSLAVIQNQEELGSGVLVSPDGYLLTAAHVVKENSNVAVYLHSGEVLAGQVLRVDAKHDMALVKISGHGLSCRPLQVSTPLAGQPVYGAGIVLDKHRLMYRVTPGQLKDNAASSDWLRFDADLPVGNSGGPFLNERGEIIGLIGWKTTTSNPNRDVVSYGASAAAIRGFIPVNISNRLLTE